jgi:hypothetical protein
MRYSTHEDLFPLLASLSRHHILFPPTPYLPIGLAPHLLFSLSLLSLAAKQYMSHTPLGARLKGGEAHEAGGGLWLQEHSG